MLVLHMALWDDRPIVEGYLKKIRGFWQNRKRYFRLTAKYIAFYEHNGGALIAAVERANIYAVNDLEPRRFELRTTCVFGASGLATMVCVEEVGRAARMCVVYLHARCALVVLDAPDVTKLVAKAMQIALACLLRGIFQSGR